MSTTLAALLRACKDAPDDPEPRQILACPGLARLQKLKLFNNRVGNRGVAALLRSPHLTRLVHLDLRKNDLSHAAGVTLRDWPQRDRMVALWVEDEQLPADLAEAVRIQD